MPKANYRILFNDGTKLLKICRIIYGSDGSFYVSVPYHPEKKALLFILTVNYHSQRQNIGFKEAIDLAGYTDEEAHLKYSHHPDGFIQFSGAGILSGRNEDGSAKGIGISSWPLDNPVSGPAFALAINGVEQFDAIPAADVDDIVFAAEEIASFGPGSRLVLEGHYAPALWRRFIARGKVEEQLMLIAHPCGAVVSAKPLFPPLKCPIQNFLSVEMYAEPSDVPVDNCEVFLSGSTGNIRTNQAGERLGDGIFYMFPDRDVGTRKTLNFQRAG